MKRALLIAVAAMAFSGMTAVAGGSGSSSSAPSESGPSYDPVEEYQKGVDALKAGEYSKAERAFKRVAKVAKKDANTRYMLGLAHYGQDEFGAAAKSFARAVKYDDKLYAAYAKLGVSYLKTDKTEKADAVLGDLTVAADACAATCAEAVGAMGVAHQMTVEYSRQRKQFGTPIGKFQVLQHRMVDMFMEHEQSISMTYMATLKLGEDPVERKKAASAAKVRIGQSGRFVGQESIQIHGGMGMTEELAVGHYFKRLTMIDSEFGNVDHHMRRYTELSATDLKAAAE